MKRRSLVAALVMTLVVTAFVASGFSRKIAISPAATPAQRESSPLMNPASSEMRATAPARFRVNLDTTKGPIVIDVTREWAPIGTDRFYNLVRQGYYDEVRFHRVTAGRWAQFGINGTPAIAKAWRHQTIPDDPFKQSNVRGTVAFAFAVPNGRTTQVFINLQDNSPTHDKEPFTPFGLVVRGMDAVDALNAEYGETAGGGIRAGKQDVVFEGGNAFLAREFPRLDYIKTARIVTAR